MRYRTPGHCEPVTDVTGVAISRIEAPFLMDEFREMAGKNACITMGRLEFDGDSHTRKANWFLNDSVVRGVRSPLQIPISRAAGVPISIQKNPPAPYLECGRMD